ncbi:flagellar hook-basal body protein [Lawsonibacter sp. LCP25S3_G6]|uniref:flagellar hook-basal body protein n=1 Tax=unclassified Lawsonibacter TaxID=2617946 RepID=UPI003F9E6C91
MTKGFYQLTSGILSQGRRLDVIGNNMTNLNTAGYKAETYTDRTFQEVLISRVGNKDKSGATVIGEESYILAPDQLYVNYSQGIMKDTGLTLDFAIQGDGFFAIQTDNGVEYTRSGSFCLNDQGQLTLAGHGTVLGADGQPITLGIDQIRADNAGRLYTQDGAYLGQLGVYTFEDNAQLVKGESGLFQAGGQQAQLQGQPQVMWKYVEESNVDMLQEMSRMLTAQRSLQSGAQVLKLYDEVLTKATNQIGQL